MVYDYTDSISLLSEYYNSNYSEYSKKLNKFSYPKNIRYELRKSKDKIPNINLDFFQTEQRFISYIHSYYISPGQKILNLSTLYYKINISPVHEKWEYIRRISITYQFKLRRGKYKLNLIDRKFLNLIIETIYVENGHPSEFWMAVISNGKVCGSLYENNTETDVESIQGSISLKCYTKLSTISLGSINIEFSEFLKNFITVSELLTNSKIDKSYGRIYLNKVLSEISNNDFRTDLEYLSTIDVPILQNIIRFIQTTTGECVIMNFMKMYNSFVDEKIDTVDWWIIINNKVGEIHCIDSKKMKSTLKFNKNQLPNEVRNFKNFMFFINANNIL